MLTTPYVIATVRGAMETMDRTAGAGGADARCDALAQLLARHLPVDLAGGAVRTPVRDGRLVRRADRLDVHQLAAVRPVTVQMWSDVRGEVDPTISAIATACCSPSRSSCCWHGGRAGAGAAAATAVTDAVSA